MRATTGVRLSDARPGVSASRMARPRARLQDENPLAQAKVPVLAISNTAPGNTDIGDDVWRVSLTERWPRASRRGQESPRQLGFKTIHREGATGPLVEQSARLALDISDDG